jgi:hypothetical protein
MTPLEVGLPYVSKNSSESERFCYSTEKNAHSVDSVRLGIRNKTDGNGIARNNSHGLYKQTHGLKIKSLSLHLQALSWSLLSFSMSTLTASIITPRASTSTLTACRLSCPLYSFLRLYEHSRGLYSTFTNFLSTVMSSMSTNFTSTLMASMLGAPSQPLQIFIRASTAFSQPFFRYFHGL